MDAEKLRHSRAEGLHLCSLLQNPYGRGIWVGAGHRMRGMGRRLPERGAPRGLSNLRMVKHEGQSQVRQPMRCLLQSGMGSAVPAAPEVQGILLLKNAGVLAWLFVGWGWGWDGERAEHVPGANRDKQQRSLREASGSLAALYHQSCHGPQGRGSRLRFSAHEPRGSECSQRLIRSCSASSLLRGHGCTPARGSEQSWG